MKFCLFKLCFRNEINIGGHGLRFRDKEYVIINNLNCRKNNIRILTWTSDVSVAIFLCCGFDCVCALDGWDRYQHSLRVQSHAPQSSSHLATFTWPRALETRKKDAGMKMKYRVNSYHLLIVNISSTEWPGVSSYLPTCHGSKLNNPLGRGLRVPGNITQITAGASHDLLIATLVTTLTGWDDGQSYPIRKNSTN